MATQFQGHFYCKLDAKGRIMFPARLKNALPEANTRKIVLRKGFEPCLDVYPQAEWDKIRQRFEGLDEFDPRVRMFNRTILMGIEEIEMDSNYRFLIPKKFINELGFKKEVKVIGVNNKIEIWDPEVLEKNLPDDELFSQLASDLMRKRDDQSQ